MDRKWKAVLDKHDLPYFRMVDCAHGNGVFADKSLPERIDVEKKLIRLIKKHCEFGIAAIVNPVRFSKPRTGHDPYSFCLNILILSLCSWMSTRKPSKVAFFFEAGHANGPKADVYLTRYRRSKDADISEHYVSHSFVGKRDARILQAADLLSWQSAKFMKDKNRAIRPPRRDFVSLMQKPHAFHYIVLHNNDLCISIDQSPHIPYAPKDEYLRSMFRYDVDSDKFLEMTHTVAKSRQIEI